MEYYVYYLIDPRTEKVFYIGKGCKRRMYNHVNEVRRGRIPNHSNIKLGNKIKSILDAGLNVRYEKVFITTDENEAYNRECELINEIGLERLCNLTEGGEGSSGYKHSDEAKRKMSKAKTGENHPMHGKILSDDIKKKISDTNSGRKHPMHGKRHSFTTKQQMSKSHKGQIAWNKGLKTGPRSEETKRKISNTLKNKYV